MQVFKYTAIALVMVSLTACIKVEDNNNNDDLVTALQQQNEILTAQNEAQQSEASVTLIGKVTNISTDSSAQTASVIIKVGSAWSEPTAVAADGSFELSALPFNSDYTLVVQSEDSAFLSRTYYGSTKEGSTGINYQDIGTLQVSEGELKSFSFLDSKTNESVLGLKLYSISHIIQQERAGVVSGDEKIFHTSSYNETTSQYEIMLPKDIVLNLYGSLDLDGDGDNDYQVEGSNNYTSYLVHAESVNDTSTIYLIDQTPLEQNIEFRISALDEESNVLEDLTLIIDDDTNGKIFSEFDDTIGQYVINAKLTQSVEILLPAFNLDNKTFDSSRVYISRYSDDRLRIQTPGYSGNGYHTTITYYVPENSEVLDIVLQPEHNTSGSSQIKVVAKTSSLGTQDATYKVFYSQPIELSGDSVELKQKDVLTVVRGNDSLDDLVLSGTTLVSRKDIIVSTNSDLSLNNTQLTVIPESVLPGGYQYQYLINEVVDSSTNTLVNISGDDSSTFFLDEKNDDAFDINTLRLDNNNYYNNGELIKAENTAGDATNYSHRSNYANVIVPTTAVNTFKSLTLQKMIVTNQNNSTNNVNSWQIIKDGQLNNLSTRYALSTSENEIITYENSNNYSIIRGMAHPDGQIYMLSTSEYLYDNTDDSENSIIFQYSFETIEGEISTGDITLEVQ